MYAEGRNRSCPWYLSVLAWCPGPAYYCPAETLAQHIAVAAHSDRPCLGEVEAALDLFLDLARIENICQASFNECSSNLELRIEVMRLSS